MVQSRHSINICWISECIIYICIYIFHCIYLLISSGGVYLASSAQKTRISHFSSVLAETFQFRKLGQAISLCINYKLWFQQPVERWENGPVPAVFHSNKCTSDSFHNHHPLQLLGPALFTKSCSHPWSRITHLQGSWVIPFCSWKN